VKKFIAVAALSFVFASFADLYKRSLDQYQAKDYAGLIATLRACEVRPFRKVRRVPPVTAAEAA